MRCTELEGQKGRPVARRAGALKRARATGALGLFLLSLLAARVASGGEGELQRDDLVRGCLDHINHERYAEAFRCSEALKRGLPDSPAGAFVAATAYQTTMSDYRVRRFEREFEREITDAILKAKRTAAQDPSAENEFLWGAAEGYRCVHWFRQGRWLKAVRAAFRGAALLRQARESAPDFADPLMGLALYGHAKSKLRLLGLGLFGDHAAEIQRQLVEAEERSRFVSINARYARQYVLVDRGEYARALPINDRLHAEFPRNPVCLYNRALILERLGRAKDAATSWRRLLDVIYAFPQPSQGFLAECHLHLALGAREEGDVAQAQQLLARAKAHADSRRVAEELDGPYVAFAETRKAILRTQREWTRDVERAPAAR